MARMETLMSTAPAVSSDPVDARSVLSRKRPTPPPMRVVTKGWFRTTEEAVPLEQLIKDDEAV